MDFSFDLLYPGETNKKKQTNKQTNKLWSHCIQSSEKNFIKKKISCTSSRGFCPDSPSARLRLLSLLYRWRCGIPPSSCWLWWFTGPCLSASSSWRCSLCTRTISPGCTLRCGWPGQSSPSTSSSSLWSWTCSGLRWDREETQTKMDIDWQRERERELLFVGCLMYQQHASASQGRIYSDNFTCCHTEMEAADQTFYLTQSQYTDTGVTSPIADPITPGAWQGSHWCANF